MCLTLIKNLNLHWSASRCFYPTYLPTQPLCIAVGVTYCVFVLHEHLHFPRAVTWTAIKIFVKLLLFFCKDFFFYFQALQHDLLCVHTAESVPVYRRDENKATDFAITMLMEPVHYVLCVICARLICGQLVKSVIIMDIDQQQPVSKQKTNYYSEQFGIQCKHISTIIVTLIWHHK